MNERCICGSGMFLVTTLTRSTHRQDVIGNTYSNGDGLRIRTVRRVCEQCGLEANMRDPLHLENDEYHLLCLIPDHGSVRLATYDLLARLRRRGLITSETHDDGHSTVRLTDAGRRALSSVLASPALHVDLTRDE